MGSVHLIVTQLTHNQLLLFEQRVKVNSSKAACLVGLKVCL